MQARELDRIANKVGERGGEAVAVVDAARQLSARASRSRQPLDRLDFVDVEAGLSGLARSGSQRFGHPAWRPRSQPS